MAAAPLVQPVVALCAWTFVMEIWLYAYRIPDASRYKVPAKNGMTLQEFNAKIPRHRQYPADNFSHLHEQPTVFYAIALTLALLERNDPTTVGLAWVYVALRIAHSLVQATTNVTMLRFQIFLGSSLTLSVLTVRAGLTAF